MQILEECRKELTNGKLNGIIDKGSYISVPCPFHSEGHERNNSCGVISLTTGDKEFGTFNCFTCKESGRLPKFIAACFDRNEQFATDWLIKKFGVKTNQQQWFLPKIELPQHIPIVYADESILESFQPWHPYMQKRKLTPQVIHDFKIKYDDKTESIIFPVWDEVGNYLFYTSRNVNTKEFHIPSDVEKPVYLMNFINLRNIKRVVVCESQINALTCWTYGIPAIALFGSSLTNYQADILNKSGVRYYVLALDGDDAGKSGVLKFVSKIRKDVFIDILNLPPDKDVNDLSRDEFITYFRNYLN